MGLRSMRTPILCDTYRSMIRCLLMIRKLESRCERRGTGHRLAGRCLDNIADFHAYDQWRSGVRTLASISKYSTVLIILAISSPNTTYSVELGVVIAEATTEVD